MAPDRPRNDWGGHRSRYSHGIQAYPILSAEAEQALWHRWRDHNGGGNQGRPRDWQPEPQSTCEDGLECAGTDGRRGIFPVSMGGGLSTPAVSSPCSGRPT
jgi:hypothetical protein